MAAAAAAAAAQAAAEANTTAAVPSTLLPAPGPDGEIIVPPVGTEAAADPIGELLATDPATAEADPAALGTDEEAVPAEPVAPKRKTRRRKARPDDWKKNYSIFGGGF